MAEDKADGRHRPTAPPDSVAAPFADPIGKPRLVPQPEPGAEALEHGEPQLPDSEQEASEQETGKP